ncbi:mRNA triphosphatase CET1 [Polychaeton citri CBS 116435]|uniref:mRNA-capping enzyme subunit beta n=1 Tax=Polychaeton citri CBS 116435 TaxID=1314669 RepID=A0A9P4Q8M2_9PEZI|nr:mRNA triphosphatase CET1 [Polychaeton citri CBS 116435]
MDLSKIMSDGPVRSASQSQTNSPEAQRHSIHGGLPPGTFMSGGGGGGGTNGGHASLGSQPSTVQPTHTPGSYVPPQLQSQHSGTLSLQKALTPLQTPTPSQSYAAGYPFPQQASQSPAVGMGYRTGFEGTGYGQTVHTPGAAQRPQSHGHMAVNPPPYPSPSNFASTTLPPGIQHQRKTSVSPTPSSHHSQASHSVRHSPLNSIHQHPPHQHHVQPHQHSQPSTPLGPPPLHYARTSAHSSMTESPHQHRVLSSASNGMSASSPAQLQMGIGNLVESPGVQSKERYQSPHMRRTSEHMSDREKSASVSPKTISQPHPYSIAGSRHSSQQDIGSQKMGMSNILSPSRDHGDFQHRSLTSHTVNGQPDSSTAITRMPHVSSGESLLQQPIATPASRKRPATIEAENQPPVKKERTLSRRTPDRPPWARLSPRNPQFRPGVNGAVTNTHANGHHHHQQRQQQQQQQRPTHPPQTPDPPQAANGTAAVHNHTTPQPNSDQPWRDDPPLDHDLIHARKVLGPWEKTFRWNTPYPDMLRVVQDWLYAKISEHADVGNDPRTGAIEIEAKIGTLIDHRTNDRWQSPIASICALRPEANPQFRFESRMEEAEHQRMNLYLNSTIRQSIDSKGRIPLTYKHLMERDVFEALSPAGMEALPPSALSRVRSTGRELKLRTTVNISEKDKDGYRVGQVKARIVKLPLGDLHIHSPNDPYDCRISMNLEVNATHLAEQGLDLVDKSGPQAPARQKDRVSYKHLAYSVDLTKVEVKGMAPKYELELEVDANILRQQMSLMAQGQDNAFGEVVSGFVDNATFLMRQRT